MNKPTNPMENVRRIAHYVKTNGCGNTKYITARQTRRVTKKLRHWRKRDVDI